MLIIDTHPHIYSEDEIRYPTIENPLRPPKGTGTPAHLKREMDANGVNKCIVIQTSTFYRWDNRFVRDTVKGNLPPSPQPSPAGGSRAHSGNAAGGRGRVKDLHPPLPRAGEGSGVRVRWMTGVCTLDPDNVHSPDVLAHFVEHCGIRGMRSIPNAQNQYDCPGVAALWRTARELGIVINALVNSSYANELASLLKKLPDLRVVLDHCMNPDFKSPGSFGKPGAAERVKIVCALARFKNLHAKLTFIPTDSAEEFPFPDTHAAMKQIIKEYGPDRCVWGSDFPTELWCPKCTYAQHLELFRSHLGLKAREQEAILGGTAERLWFSA